MPNKKCGADNKVARSREDPLFVSHRLLNSSRFTVFQEDTLFSHCAVQLPHLHSTLHMFPSVIPKEVDPPPQLERNIVGGNVEIVIHELVNIFSFNYLLTLL